MLVVMSGQLVLLNLSTRLQTTVVLGSDSAQLVLKPLSESLGQLVLLIQIGVHCDGVDYNPGRVSVDRTGKMISPMQPMCYVFLV